MSEAEPEAGDERDGAEKRTDWAKERTLLAKQLGDVEPAWMVQAASVLMIVAGALMSVIGFLEYRKVFDKLREEGV